MNICEHLTATARIFPDRDAIRFEDSVLTYQQLDRLSLAVGNYLQAGGIQPGDRVALMLSNVPAFAVWYFGALRVGAIAVSLSTRSATSEIASLVKDCGARCFVGEEAKFQELCDAFPSTVSLRAYASDAGDTVNGEPLQVSDVKSTWLDLDPDEAATILYTSGTTGFAKGATLSHMNVRTNVHAFNHLCNMQAHDRILLAVPLFHCFGQNALLNSAFNVGATLVLQRRFDLNESKRLIAEHQVTQLYGVPMMFQLFLESCEPDELSSLDYCFSAAAPLPIQVARRWQEKFGLPIHEGYGLTESSPFASYNHRLHFVPGSIGTPIDAVEMKVIDTETGTQCAPDEPGEIVIRGPNVMLGYWNRPEETAATIRNGWLHSGDIGRVDERGYFYVVDRVKDMISVGGLKVFPAEVERVLLDHADVSQVAVVGLPDEVFGEQVVAYVVLTSSSAGTEDDALDRIRSYAKQHLANYKVPRTVLPIEELPRNPSGKVLKRSLRELGQQTVPVTSVNSATSGESSQNAQHQLRPATLRDKLLSTHASARRQVAIEFVQHLVQVIADVSELPAAEDRFLEAGLDSLMIVELSNQIQVELGPEHNVPATLVFDYPRITDLADFLMNALLPESSSTTAASTGISGQDSSDPQTADTKSDLRAEIATMSEAEALEELMKELEQ